MPTPSTPDPRKPAPDDSFASRNAATILGFVALGLIILATVWSLIRNP